MSIKGFEVGGVQQRYDYESLDNIPANLVQDANYVHTDNNFTNADKTKLSGIEAQANKTTIDATLTHSGQAADAKATGDAISALDAQVIASMPHDTASGSIASFPDGAAMPVIDCSVAVAPNQNLHGYDNPWPAGGGKNLTTALADGSSTNVGINFAWSGNHFDASEAATASNGQLDVYTVGTSLESGTSYTLSFIGTGNDKIKAVWLYFTDSTYLQIDFYGATSKTFTVSGSVVLSSIRFRTLYVSGDTANMSVDWQLERGSTATAWTPYSNICPISGWTEANVTRTGKNLLDPSARTTSAQNIRYYQDDNLLLKAGTYTLSISSQVSGLYVNSGASTLFEKYNSTFLTFTLTEDTPVHFNFYKSGIDTSSLCQLELGSTASSYEAYQGTTYTIDLDGTRYGGTLDGTSGKLTVTMVMVDLGTLNWSTAVSAGITRFRAPVAGIKRVSLGTELGQILCSNYATKTANQTYVGQVGISQQQNTNDVYIYDPQKEALSAADFKAAMSGVMLVYELATPIEVDLTPTEITTLLGTNNIFADCGDITVSYYADTTLFVNKKIAAAVAALS